MIEKEIKNLEKRIAKLLKERAVLEHRIKRIDSLLDIHRSQIQKIEALESDNGNGDGTCLDTLQPSTSRRQDS